MTNKNHLWLGLGVFLLIGLAIFFQGLGEEKSAPTQESNRQSQSSSEDYQKESYGVFIGMDKDQLFSLTNTYDTMVIDASKLSKEDLDQVKGKTKQLYSYLNVGALEKSSEFYEAYKHLTLKPYDNWPDEYWIDVRNKAWQDGLLARAKDLKAKGVDGLFLDNFDIYYQYKRKDVYQSLLTLLERCKELEMPIIINGGDTFVSKLLEEETDADQLIDAVNQEGVVTRYDFDKKKAVKQEADTLSYYHSYLRAASKSGIKTYTIEYASNKSQKKAIREDARTYNYQVYLAETIGLDKE